MAKATSKLSDTARAMLTRAATREDRLVRPPTLPAAARLQVVRSLLNHGFAEEVPGPVNDTEYRWRTGDDGTVLMLRATDKGLAAIGDGTALTDEPATIEAFTRDVLSFLADEGCNATILEAAEARTMVEDGFANGRPAGRVAGDIIDWLAETEDEAGAAAEAANPGVPTADTATEDAVAREAAAVADALDAASTAPARANLRAAAQAVLDAWNAAANRETDVISALEGPIAALRAALTGRRIRPASTGPRPPRTGTKQAQVLTLLRRDEGATIAQIIEATGWQSHTVRGFLAGLKKKGMPVEVLERVRQVGPDKQGAKGSYSIYRITG
ncbi:MAG: DUF3489 domain-containing protein [Acetobacteraceae bacterium]